MARRKSYDQILGQVSRIERNPRTTASRTARAYIAADRYTDNIMRQRGFRGNGAYSRKYTRSTYMGLSVG